MKTIEIYTRTIKERLWYVKDPFRDKFEYSIIYDKKIVATNSYYHPSAYHLKVQFEPEYKGRSMKGIKEVYDIYKGRRNPKMKEMCKKIYELVEQIEEGLI